jgi:hypothetical protein
VPLANETRPAGRPDGAERTGPDPERRYLASRPRPLVAAVVPSRDPELDQPEFGPSGYLPERAAKRARKIVLRAPLGLQWVVASLVAGLVVVVAGVLFLQRGAEPPPAPWVAAGAIEELHPARFDPSLGVLLVTGGGRVRALVAADEVAYCAASNRLEAADGRVWSLTGRGFAGTASLEEHPTQLHDGQVYVDPTVSVPGPAPTADEVAAGCS